MREYELEVLEQYHIEVGSTRKIRGAFFCDTDQGGLLLKEASYSIQRAPSVYMLCKQLEEKGVTLVDTIVPTKTGAFLCVQGDGRKYVLKKWFRGSECAVKNERDIILAVRNLASLHAQMYWREVCEISEQKVLKPPLGHDLTDEYRRHNQEFGKIRKFIRSQSTKQEFECIYLKNYEAMYRCAEHVSEQLERSAYDNLYKESIQSKALTHGDYNYHNVLMTPEGVATVNFESFRMDIQVSDLYNFLRKVMEKQRWRPELGSKILDAYQEVRPLSDHELEYIAIRLAYPEKFWKIANTYYLSNKA